jgi:2',3'-cyclic-nucleotide 2'-phosphodiesterase
MAGKIRALVLGDIVGQPGCRAVFIGLKALMKEYKSDFVVINGENAADGFGITPEIAAQIFASGADVITSGNHIWQKREIYPLLDSDSPILRPANYPIGTPGKGHVILEIKGIKIAVLNLQGRKDFGNLDCPFRIGLDISKKIRNQAKIIIVDFHAESVNEKEALGIYLDGKVSAVLGTHTHIQTADERILPGGTAYLSDLGMTGPSESVIGSDYNISVRRSLTQMPLKHEVANNPAIMSGVVLDLDVLSGKCISIKRFKKLSSL